MSKTPEVSPLPKGPVIDASLFGESLSHEYVSRGELEGMLLVAEHLLEKDGTQTTVNGLPALVTEHSTEVTIDGSPFYAKVFRLLPVKGENIPPSTGIVFDETPDSDVLTPNPFAIRFLKSGDTISLIVDRGLDPLINDPVYTEKVKEILKTITQQATEAEKDRSAERQLQREERIKKVKQSSSRLGKLALKYVPIAGGAIIGLAAVSAGLFGLYKVPWSDLVAMPDTTTQFDNHHYTLSGGKVIAMGQTASPDFSPELLERTALDSYSMPDVDGSVLKVANPLREVSIAGDKANEECQIFYVEKVPEGTILKAWTDYVGADGNGVAKAKELQVTFNEDEGKVCWSGQSEKDQSLPRVVLKLVPPQTPHS